MRFRIATIFAAAALFFAPGANAALTLYLTDGTNSVLATDIGNTGLISFNGPLGSGPWVANVTTGLSKPLLTPIRMDLNSVNVSSTGGGDLTIILADNGWPAGGGGFTQAIGGTVSDLVGSTLRATAYVVANGTLPVLGTPLPAGAVLIADSGLIGPGAFASTITGTAGALPAGYTLIEKVVIHHTGADSTSFDDKLTAVPEPASLALLGAALLASSKLLRKKLVRS